MKIDNPMEIEPDKVLSDSRRRLLAATGKVVELGSVEKSCNMYGDSPHEMTGARLFARFLSQFSFYYPQTESKSEHAPSIDAAWAYWEHVTLARYYTDEKKGTWTRATIGDRDRPTALYPVFSTPTQQMSDWGISVRIYFSTLLGLAAFLFLAGVLNLPLMYYFWNYAEGGKEGISNSVKGSAVCDDAEWEYCSDCADSFDVNGDEAYRIGNNGWTLVNACDFESWAVPGVISYGASLVLIGLFGIAFFWLQRKAEILFDEEIQTASDYSIKISNPPKDALDPDEWQKFLAPFCSNDVALITIAIDNADLIKALIKRRRLLKRLAKLLPVGADMKLASAVPAQALPKKCSLFTSAAKVHIKLKKVEATISELVLTKSYGAVSVFCTFENESSQRRCLHALSTGKLNVMRNTLDLSKFENNPLNVQEAVDLKTSLRFRGKKVLDVKEAGEPNDVRWTDLQVPRSVRSTQYFMSTIIMWIFIAWSGFFIYGLEKRKSGTAYTPLFITATNIIVPKICEFVNKIESHSTEASRNISLYVKIALFRWFNSAICLSIIMSFIETISVQDGNEGAKPTLPETVYNIIYAEMFTIPLLKILDIMGNIRKHILAPRAKTQEDMNSCFAGAKFELAERYSDATKVLFVALFYSAIMPQSLFMGAAALLVHFWSGKFCLMRLWRGTPDIGPHLARLSRNYFFSVTLIIHVIMSGYFWSGYPYDNVCRSNDDDGSAQYCNQDMFRSGIFPPLPRYQPDGMEWMSSSQELITSLYGWTSLAMVTIAILVFLNLILIPYIRSYFRSSYEPDGEDQGVTFSSVKSNQEVQGYIPQLRETGFAHPLIACDLSGLDDEHLLGWVDEFNGYKPHSLANDLRDILGGDLPSKTVFSIVKQFSISEQTGQSGEPSSDEQSYVEMPDNGIASF